MRILFIVIMIEFFSSKLIAQTNHVPNSFKEIYDSRFPGLKYAYDTSSQTHDYSGNWDFDGDKNADSILFVGNGGAHLYFHLRLKLSSEHTVRDFHFLVTDFPALDSIAHFKKEYGKSALFPVFVVHDFNNDGRMDIYLNTDTGFVPIPPKWRKRGVNSRSLLISYKQKDIVIRNFSGIVN